MCSGRETDNSRASVWHYLVGVAAGLGVQSSIRLHIDDIDYPERGPIKLVAILHVLARVLLLSLIFFTSLANTPTPTSTMSVQERTYIMVKVCTTSYMRVGVHFLTQIFYSLTASNVASLATLFLVSSSVASSLSL